MARKIDTLNELNLYLENNQEAEVLNASENFFEKEPLALTKVDYVSDKTDRPKPSEEKSQFTSKELADYIHTRAKEENKSFADLWLEVLEEGAKKDMLIPFDKAIQTWAIIPAKSLSILKESLNTTFRLL
jgi:hypothetical protein